MILCVSTRPREPCAWREREPTLHLPRARTNRALAHGFEPGAVVSTYLLTYLLEKAIKALAKAWKDTLKKGDAELGIDPEFTRPGIESLLEQLEDDFSSCEPTQDFKFKWR